MGTLSKSALVTRALEFIDTGLQSTAELWVDLLLDSLAHNYRWAQLFKQNAASLGDGGSLIAYPSDYGFLVRDPTGGHVGTFLQSGATGASKLYADNVGNVLGHPLHTTDNKGTPVYVADDPTNSRWVLHPISNVAGTVTFNYQRVPAAGASGAVTWFPDDLALMEAVRAWAEQYDRGGLVTVTIQQREAAMAKALRSPMRAQLWANAGPGADLDKRMFR